PRASVRCRRRWQRPLRQLLVRGAHPQALEARPEKPSAGPQLTGAEVPRTDGSMSVANGPSGLSMSHTCSIRGVVLLVLPRGQAPLFSLLSKKPECANATAMPLVLSKQRVECW